MTWTNADGLIVKQGLEEAVENKSGELSTLGPNRLTTFTIDYTEMLSATAVALGSTTGPLGAIIPSGARIEEVEIYVETAFTSSGTIGSSTVVLGLNRLDRTTEIDADGFTTTSATGTALGLATVGTKTVLRKGSTGAGALIGAAAGAIANPGYLVVANSAHASHPFTAGRLIVRVYWRPSQG